MAGSRDRFLDDHPYGYSDYDVRKRHELLRDRAYNDSLKARGDFVEHYRYAG